MIGKNVAAAPWTTTGGRLVEPYWAGCSHPPCCTTVLHPALHPRWGANCPSPTPARPHPCCGSLQQAPLQCHGLQRQCIWNRLVGNICKQEYQRTFISLPISILVELNFECVHTWWEKTCQVMRQRKGGKKGPVLEASLKEGLQGFCKAVIPSPPLLLLLFLHGNPMSHVAAWGIAALVNGCSLVLARWSKERLQPCQTFRCSPTYCWFSVLQICVSAMKHSLGSRAERSAGECVW